MRYLDDLDNLKREKEEFEKYTIENYFLIKEDLEKDDWGSYEITSDSCLWGGD